MQSSDSFLKISKKAQEVVNRYKKENDPGEEVLEIKPKMCLSDINLDKNSTFEDIIKEALRFSEPQKNQQTDEEIEKETLYRFAEDGLLNLSKAEIDLLFLKRKYPVKPELRKVPEGFSNLGTKKLIEDLKLLVVVVISILGVVASVSITAFPQAPSWAVLLTITITGLAWCYTFYKVSKT